MTREIGRQRDGFTMVELLVTITIIAVLVSLTAAAVLKGRDAVIRGKNRSQMEQITFATSNFCAAETMGRVGFLPPPPFRLQNTYTGTEPEFIYLKQVFPNLQPTGTGLPGTAAAPVILADGNQIALFFLTGGEVTGYSGFSNNSSAPFNPPTVQGETRKGPYLQLQTDMFSKSPRGVTANTQAWLIDPYKTPYAIFLPGPKGTYTNSSGGAQTVTIGGTTINPFKRGSKFENPKTLQIISAGQDKLFGVGGDWSGSLDGSAPGYDDVSNFSAGVIGVGPQ